MNIFAETVVRKLLQIVFACLFAVIAAVFVAGAEPLKGGGSHGGKRIAYLVPSDKEGGHRVVQQHGIIAAESDLPIPLTWFEAEVTCDSLTLRGFSDWTLPGKEELSKLFFCKEVLGGFQNSDYWSSKTFKSDSAWSKRFLDGKEDLHSVKNRFRVRPVRKF